VTAFEPELSARLRPAKNVLVAGAGGGFDVYAGLPLAFALHAAGKRVSLANLSFSDLGRLSLDDWVAPELAAVTPGSTGDDEYFPERTLARWLAGTELAPVVYTFPRTGVRPLRSAYETLIEQLSLDAIVLVDGGTDILMRGDEAGLGTPEEDMTSLAAVASVPGALTRLVACLGFGIDSYHGVSHAHVLENLAALQRSGAYLGAFSIPPGSPEAAVYLEAVAHAERFTPARRSIVNGQIAAALRGEFGDVHASDRTHGSELFVNPLMSMYFTVDLLGLAESVTYLPALANTDDPFQVALAIEEHRAAADRRRPPRPLPH
jgi:hypothetical protein